jgi:AP-3 complex subunit delta-1
LAEPDRPKLASLAYTPSSQRFVVDKGGEMPAGQPRTPTQVPSAPASRPRTPLHAPPAALFQLYDAGEDDTRPSTPDPIKVTRAKKGSGKKRTPKLSGGDSTELH